MTSLVDMLSRKPAARRPKPPGYLYTTTPKEYLGWNHAPSCPHCRRTDPSHFSERRPSQLCDDCEQRTKSLLLPPDPFSCPDGVNDSPWCACHAGYYGRQQVAVATLILAGLKPELHFDPKASVPLAKAHAAILLNRLGLPGRWRAWLTEPACTQERARWLTLARPDERAEWLSSSPARELDILLGRGARAGLAALVQPHPAKADTGFASSSEVCVLPKMPLEVLQLIMAQLDFHCLRRAMRSCALFRHFLLNGDGIARAWVCVHCGCDGTRPNNTEVRESPIEGKGLFAQRTFAEGEFVGEYCGVVDTGHGAVSEHTFGFGVTTKSRNEPQESKFFLNPMCLGDTALQQMMYANHSCEPNMRAYVVGLEAFFDNSLVRNGILDHPVSRWCMCDEQEQRQVVLFMATQQINTGEELTFNYCEGRMPDFVDLLRPQQGLGENEVCKLFRGIFFEESEEMLCNCKARGCTGYVFGCCKYWGILHAREEERKQMLRAGIIPHDISVAMQGFAAG